MTRQEIKERYVVDEIIKRTSHWNLDMWYDFRNVFIPDYYEIRLTSSRVEFNEWKLYRIKVYNTFLVKQ